MADAYYAASTEYLFKALESQNDVRWIGLRQLLVDSPVVFEPTCHMPSFRVVVRPVNDPSLFVPHVFALESYAIAFTQPVNPRCDVYVVSDEYRLARGEANNESLMAISGDIVGQYARHHALALDLHVARPRLERAPDRAVVIDCGLRTVGVGCDLIMTGRANLTATACTDQGATNECGNVNPAHRQ